MTHADAAEIIMDKTQINQQQQQVETQTNAQNAHAHERPASMEGRTPSMSPSVSRQGRLSRNVPTPSAIFTGREAELQQIHDALQTVNNAAAPLLFIVKGRRGVGKTQTAAQYAHQFRDAYEGVFWVSGETPEELQTQITALAPDLVPPLPTLPNEPQMFQAVVHWFAAHTNWLLIVDTAEEAPDLKFLLSLPSSGRILLTSLNCTLPGEGSTILLTHMDDEIGATLLLRAAGVLAPDASLDTVGAEMQAEAMQVNMEMSGLPLALDQAGAYMRLEALAPAAFQQRCRERSQSLHPDYSVAAFLAWEGFPQSDYFRVEAIVSLILEQVRSMPNVGGAAIQLAYLCAFLALDAIPDEVFLTSPDVLPDALAPFAWNAADFREVWRALCDAALVRRETDFTGLSIHELTQHALHHSLSDGQRRAMAEQAMQIVNAAFPEPEFPVWPLGERLLPHALICIEHIKKYALRTLPAVHLLNKTAQYLQQRARHDEANPLFVLALAIEGQVRGKEYPGMAAALNDVGITYREKGNYAYAAFFLEEAVAIDRRVLRDDNATYMAHLDTLAELYCEHYPVKKVVPLREQALDITRRTLGSQHPSIVVRLSDLAIAYSKTERYEEAATLWQEMLPLDRQTIGESHPDYADHLLSLAAAYIRLSRFEAAEPLLRQALSIYEQAHGPQHPDIADCHYWQGEMCYMQGNMTAALAPFQRALEIQERTRGPQHEYTRWIRIRVGELQRELADEGG